MIEARHTRLGVWFFDVYLTWRIRRHFREVVIEGLEEVLEGKSLLLLANHHSWWDGFLVVYANRFHLRRRYHVMMTEHELRKRMMLTTGGAYGIAKGTRSLVETLKYTLRVLENPENLVLMFPQGIILPAAMGADFEQGVLRIVAQRPENCQVLFCSTWFEYGSYDKPTAFVAYHAFIGQVAEAQEAYNAFRKQHLEGLRRRVIALRPGA